MLAGHQAPGCPRLARVATGQLQRVRNTRVADLVSCHNVRLARLVIRLRLEIVRALRPALVNELSESDWCSYRNPSWRGVPITGSSPVNRRGEGGPVHVLLRTRTSFATHSLQSRQAACENAWSEMTASAIFDWRSAGAAGTLNKLAMIRRRCRALHSRMPKHLIGSFLMRLVVLGGRGPRSSPRCWTG